MLWVAVAGCAGSAKYLDCVDNRLWQHLRVCHLCPHLHEPLHTHCECPASRRLSLIRQLAFPTKNTSRLHLCWSTSAIRSYDHIMVNSLPHCIVLTILSIFVMTIHHRISVTLLINVMELSSGHLTKREVSQGSLLHEWSVVCLMCVCVCLFCVCVYTQWLDTKFMSGHRSQKWAECTGIQMWPWPSLPQGIAWERSWPSGDVQMSTVAKDCTYLCLKYGGCNWSCSVGRWSLLLESLLCGFTVPGLPKSEHTRPNIQPPPPKHKGTGVSIPSIWCHDYWWQRRNRPSERMGLTDLQWLTAETVKFLGVPHPGYSFHRENSIRFS